MSIVEQMRSSETQHQEGPVAKTIEQQTAKMPSDIFLWSALGSIGLSLFFQLTGEKKAGNFVATWVPTLLTLGVYNKIVKVAGSDKTENAI